DVVFDTGGNAALVWQRWDGSSNVVQASYRPADGEWEPAVDLSEEGSQGMDAVVVLDAPGDATAADGHATAVWVSDDCPGEKGSCDVVQAAGYDPEGLPEVEIEAPATGIVGEPVEISTPTEELFAPLLEFGDGKSVADTEASHVYEAPGEYEVSLAGAEVLGYRASAQRTITIAPAGPGAETEPEDEPETESPGAGAGHSAVLPATASAPAGSLPSQDCAAAAAARDSALRRLRAIGARLSHARSTREARRLAAAKRSHATAVRRARHRAAAAC
ncbi:MAG TPA: PKD domain-containing protein, partial [Solirubrobacterales bacterium]|nr:PKD domain-containing protein [Solirubrobacterales bacterium]